MRNQLKLYISAPNEETHSFHLKLVAINNAGNFVPIKDASDDVLVDLASRQYTAQNGSLKKIDIYTREYSSSNVDYAFDEITTDTPGYHALLFITGYLDIFDITVEYKGNNFYFKTGKLDDPALNSIHELAVLLEK